MERKINMKSKKIVKIGLFGIIIIFLLLFGINYNTYKKINIKELFNIMLFDNNNYSSEIIDSDTIKNTEIINIGEENSIGISVNNYHLDLENKKYNYISTISVEVNEKSKNDNFLIMVYYNNDNISKYSSDDFIFSDNDEKVYVINKSNINKITISSSTEEFDNEEKTGKTIDIEQIKINSKDDINDIKTIISIKSVILFLTIILLIIVYYILIKFKGKDKVPNNKLPNIFFIMSSIIGTIFSILFPLYQIPDELTHINMMYSEMNMKVDFYGETNGFGDTARIMHNYNEKVDVDEYFDFNDKLSIKENYNFPSISLVRHFPQMIGMFIGEIFKLPIIISITLAEFLAVLFYSFVCSRALKKIPIKKELMMAIMLLPICLQQMGSFSYDAVLLPICFYFISYIFYLKFDKKEITLKDCIILLILLIIIALIKIPYILLGLLVFLLPIKKFNIDFHIFKIDYKLIKNNYKKIILILIPIIILCIILVVKILCKINYGRVLIAAILEPKASIKIILNTIYTYKFGYLKELTGKFGWFDTSTSNIYTIFIIICIFIICFINFKRDKDKKQEVCKNPFTKKETIFMYILGIIMILLIVLSMFSWTAYVTGYTIDNYSISELRNLFKTFNIIGGVQGRYFLPIIPILLIPIYSNKVTKYLSKFNISLFLIIYYLIVFVYMIIVVLFRYWI